MKMLYAIGYRSYDGHEALRNVDPGFKIMLLTQSVMHDLKRYDVSKSRNYAEPESRSSGDSNSKCHDDLDSR